MTGFARIFRGLVDSFPSSGAGPTAKPDQLSEEISLVHEVSHVLARADERRIFQTAGAAGVSVINHPPAATNRYQYVFGAGSFHDDVVARLIEYYVFEPLSTLAIQIRSSRDFVPGGHAANEIFALARPILVPPGCNLRVFVPALGVAAVIRSTMLWLDVPFQDLPAGP